MAEKEPWDKEIYKAMKADSEKVVRAASQEKHNNKSLTSRALTFTVVTMFYWLVS